MTSPSLDLAALSSQAGRHLAQLLHNEPGVVAAWQYGSSLREDFRPGKSDIDLLLVVTDELPAAKFAALSHSVRAVVELAEVTFLRRCEVEAAIHPGWSSHYFINVARSGVHLCGPDLLAGVSAPCWEQAHRRLTQLTQRARLLIANPSKAGEVTFWLAKYQQWVPLCLMELLDLHGIREDRLRKAPETFSRTFPNVAGAPPYPYESVTELHQFLEQLTRWVTDRRSTERCCRVSPSGGSGGH